MAGKDDAVDVRLDLPALIDAVDCAKAMVDGWRERLTHGVRIGDDGRAMWQTAKNEIMQQERSTGLLRQLSEAQRISPDDSTRDYVKLLHAWVSMIRQAHGAKEPDASRRSWKLAEDGAGALAFFLERLVNRLRLMPGSDHSAAGHAQNPVTLPPSSLMAAMRRLLLEEGRAAGPIFAESLKWNPLSEASSVSVPYGVNFDNAEAVPDRDDQAEPIDDGPLFEGLIFRKLWEVEVDSIPTPPAAKQEVLCRLAVLKQQAGELKLRRDGTGPDFPIDEVLRIGRYLEEDERIKIVGFERSWLRVLRASKVLLDRDEDEDIDEMDEDEIVQHILQVAGQMRRDVAAQAWESASMWLQINILADEVRGEVRSWVTAVEERVSSAGGAPTEQLTVETMPVTAAPQENDAANSMPPVESSAEEGTQLWPAADAKPPEGFIDEDSKTLTGSWEKLRHWILPQGTDRRTAQKVARDGAWCWARQLSPNKFQVFFRDPRKFAECNRRMLAYERPE